MFIPIRTDSRLRSTPYMNYGLILANLIVFILEQGFSTLKGKGELNPQALTIFSYFSYAFIHENILHIVGNMLFLYIFGNNVNDKMGNIGYLAFYLAGGVFAGIAFVCTSADGVPVIGASGAVAAVTGAYLVLFPRSAITVFYFLFFIGQIEIPSLWFIGFFFFEDLFLNFAHDSGVAHMAHIGGTMFGVAVCFVLLVVHLLPRDQFDVLALVQRWNKRRQYKDLVSKGFDPFGWAPGTRGDTFREAPAPTDPMSMRIAELRSQISEAAGRHDMDRATDLYLQLKAIDPRQVLARQTQMDVGNQLAHQQRYADATDAYEGLIRAYPTYDQIQNVELMLGLIYARYLERYDLAKPYLQRALARLHGEREVQMAKSELARIEPMLAPRTR